MKLPDIEIEVNPDTTCGYVDLGTFGVLPESLLLDPTVSPAAKLVYAYLWHWLMSESLTLMLGDIAHALHMDDEEVMDRLVDLEDRGYLDPTEPVRASTGAEEVYAYGLTGGRIRSLKAGRTRAKRRQAKKHKRDAAEAAETKE